MSEQHRPTRPTRNTEPDPDEVEEVEGDFSAASIRGGWTEAQKQADATSDYAQNFKPEEKVQVIKFLDDAPYAVFRRHWIDRSGPNGPYKRAYTCPQTVGRKCPLCEAGDKSTSVNAFNVALLGDDGQVLLKSWDVGVKLLNVLKGYNADAKFGPLTKGYYGVSKTAGGSGSRKGGTTQTNVIPIGARSLEEDYEIVAPTSQMLNALKKYDSDIVTIPKLSDLAEVAAEMVEIETD